MQVGAVLLRQLTAQAVGVFQGVGNGVQGRLLGLDLGAIGVATYLEARLLDQLAQVDHAVELADAVTLQQALFDLRNSGDGVVSGGAEFAAGVFAMGASLDHGSEGLSILGDGRQLLIDDGNIGRLLDLATRGLEAAVEFFHQLVDQPGTLFATAHFIVQAGLAQVFGQFIEAGNKAQFIAPADHAAKARPASEGDQKREEQHQAKAHAQLAIDAHISQFSASQRCMR